MSRSLTLIGAPSGAGACGVGQERAPAPLREAGLIEALDRAGVAVTDFGDGPVVPWRPDRDNPMAQNVDAVVDVVRTTADRVTDAVSDRTTVVLVLGGDCTVGIGTVAGAHRAFEDVGLLYFDLHSDLNTPASGRDGSARLDGARPHAGDRWNRSAVGSGGRVDAVAGPRSHRPVRSRSIQSTRFERSQIAVFTRKTWAWAAVTGAHAFALAGVLWGMVAVAAGRGPHTQLNDTYHRVMVVLLATGLILRLTPLGRASLGRERGSSRREQGASHRRGTEQ